jgi:hypothetical protein
VKRKLGLQRQRGKNNLEAVMSKSIKGINILKIKSATQTTLQFLYMARNYTANFKEDKQVAMTTAGYETSSDTVMLCIHEINCHHT